MTVDHGSPRHCYFLRESLVDHTDCESGLEHLQGQGTHGRLERENTPVSPLPSARTPSMQPGQSHVSEGRGDGGSGKLQIRAFHQRAKWAFSTDFECGPEDWQTAGYPHRTVRPSLPFTSSQALGLKLPS